MGTIAELAEKTNATVIAADATSVEDLEMLFSEAQKALGGQIDFVLHSCAMSANMRKKRTYDDLDYSLLDKTLDISAISFHKMLQVAKKMDALNDNASVLALTYVASHRTFFGYNDMADAKSLLESIARSFGYIYGREKGVRVNTISQSPTYTTAGSGIKGFDGLYDFSDRMSPLGNASADECADYCIVMFSDLTKKVSRRIPIGKQVRLSTDKDYSIYLRINTTEWFCSTDNVVVEPFLLMWVDSGKTGFQSFQLTVDN